MDHARMFAGIRSERAARVTLSFSYTVVFPNFTYGLLACLFSARNQHTYQILQAFEAR